jgi:hypothetical protein
MGIRVRRFPIRIENLVTSAYQLPNRRNLREKGQSS